VASPPTIQASYERAKNAMTPRPSYDGGYRPSNAELAGGQRLKLSAAKLPTIPQPITLAADATTLLFVHRSVRTINSFETITLFSHVTLIRKPQSTSDLDHFHARELPCSRVKRTSRYSHFNYTKFTEYRATSYNSAGE